MYRLEAAIQETLRRWKESGIAGCTLESRKRYCAKFLQRAVVMGKQKLDQELVDAYLKDNKGSREIAGMHFRIARRLDDVCSTHLMDLKGHYLNSFEYPTEEETVEFFKCLSFPISVDVPLTHLAVKTMMEIGKQNLTKSTLGQYMKALKDFNEMSRKKGVTRFSQSFCDGYLQQNEADLIHGKIEEWVRRLRRRSLLCLLYVSEHGSFTWQRFQRLEDPLSSDMKEIKNSYLHELKVRNLEPKTISLHQYVIHYLLLMLQEEQQNLWDMDESGSQRALDYFSRRCNKNSISTLAPILRAVLKFLHGKNYIKRDLEWSVMTPLYLRKQAKGYILPEDEKRLVKKIAMLNKRDKAILLMALETGLRESDILGMKLSQVDWRSDTITIVQKKTGNQLVLPLLLDVGNALASYILDERPTPVQGSEGFVFLRRQAPYRRINSSYCMVRKLMDSIDIKPANTNKAGGIHLLRHSLIYKLLKDQVPDYTITNVLGHVNKESDKPYLSLDEKMLKECAMHNPLAVPSVRGGSR